MPDPTSRETQKSTPADGSTPPPLPDSPDRADSPDAVDAGAANGAENEAESIDARQLLNDARRAQAAADRAVADLSSIKRTIADTPKLIEQRRNEVERAEQALAKAEAQLESARKVLKTKQAEAGRAVEAAAVAQQALARALTDGHDIGDEGAAIVRAGNRYSAFDSFDRTAKFGDLSRNYAPAPAHSDEDIIAYLADRDLLCPSCGMQLRGLKQASCPGCRLELSLPTLKAVRSRGATGPIWAIRVLAGLAMALSPYIAVAVLLNLSVLGCGIGGTCDLVAKSGYGKLFGVPVAGLGALLFAGIGVVTWFVNVGRSDQTRARAWSILTALSVFTAAVGVWYLIVQLAILKGFCPPCALVSLMGMAIAVIVLLRAPLNREEKVPEEAVGTVQLPRNFSMQLIGGALTVAVLAGVLQGALNRHEATIPELRTMARLERLEAEREAERRANALVMNKTRQPGDPAAKGDDDADPWADNRRELGVDDGEQNEPKGLVFAPMTHRPDEDGQFKSPDSGETTDAKSGDDAATADDATAKNDAPQNDKIVPPPVFLFGERFNLDGMTRYHVNRTDPVTIPDRKTATPDKKDGKNHGESKAEDKTGDQPDADANDQPDQPVNAPADAPKSSDADAATDE